MHPEHSRTFSSLAIAASTSLTGEAYLLRWRGELLFPKGCIVKSCNPFLKLYRLLILIRYILQSIFLLAKIPCCETWLAVLATQGFQKRSSVSSIAASGST